MKKKPVPALEHAYEKLRKASGVNLRKLYYEPRLCHIVIGLQADGWWAEAWAPRDGLRLEESAAGGTIEEAVTQAVDNWIKEFGKKAARP